MYKFIINQREEKCRNFTYKQKNRKTNEKKCNKQLFNLEHIESKEKKTKSKFSQRIHLKKTKTTEEEKRNDYY